MSMVIEDDAGIFFRRQERQTCFPIETPCQAELPVIESQKRGILMKFALLLALAIALPLSVHAGQLEFKSISCSDAVAGKAPVYIDITQVQPVGPYSIRFDFGNLVPSADNGGNLAEDGTVLGGVVSGIVYDGSNVKITGSINIVLKFDSKTGVGVISGPLKYDPSSGEYVGFNRINEHAVVCEIKPIENMHSSSDSSATPKF